MTAYQNLTQSDKTHVQHGRFRSAYSDEIIQRARLIYSRGWSPRDIVDHLKDECHPGIPEKTIANWCYFYTRKSPRKDTSLLGNAC